MTVPFPSLRTAAKALDMKPAEFRRIVDAHILPGPCCIDEHERWDMEALRRAVTGEAVAEERPKWERG